MYNSVGYGQAIIKIADMHEDLLGTIVEETGKHITIELPADVSLEEIQEGAAAAILTHNLTRTCARSGSVKKISDGRIEMELEKMAAASYADDADELTECQLPAMFRPRSPSGMYGCWKGAFIVKHGPDRLYLQIEDSKTIPEQTELMFSPIGSDTGSGTGRMYGDDGSVINAADVRSRRIRVRAITRDILASNNPGTVTLVMDITRTLYRTA